MNGKKFYYAVANPLEQFKDCQTTVPESVDYIHVNFGNYVDAMSDMIKKARKERKLTLAQLAEKANVTTYRARQIENGYFKNCLILEKYTRISKNLEREVRLSAYIVDQEEYTRVIKALELEDYEKREAEKFRTLVRLYVSDFDALKVLASYDYIIDQTMSDIWRLFDEVSAKQRIIEQYVMKKECVKNFVNNRSGENESMCQEVNV